MARCVFPALPQHGGRGQGGCSPAGSMPLPPLIVCGVVGHVVNSMAAFWSLPRRWVHLESVVLMAHNPSPTPHPVISRKRRCFQQAANGSVIDRYVSQAHSCHFEVLGAGAGKGWLETGAFASQWQGPKVRSRAGLRLGCPTTRTRAPPALCGMSVARSNRHRGHSGFLLAEQPAKDL